MFIQICFLELLLNLTENRVICVVERGGVRTLDEYRMLCD